MPDSDHPTESRHAISNLKRGESNPGTEDSSLQNEYTGEAVRDGIPANGTEPTELRGPDDVGT